MSLRAVALVAVLVIAAACGETSSSADKPSPAAGAPAAAKPYKTIAASKDYPLKTCVVSGEGLSSMGDPVAIEYEGREVQFCCDHCIDEFLKDPKTALAKLDAAKK